MQTSLCQTKTCGKRIYFGLFRSFGKVDADYDAFADGSRWRHAHNGLVTCVSGSLETATPGTIEEVAPEDFQEEIRKTGGTMHFVKFRDTSGQYRFRLTAANHEIIAPSEGYHNRSDRNSTIALIKREADQASVVDHDDLDPVDVVDDPLSVPSVLNGYEEDVLLLNRAQTAALFEEWLTRYNADPDEFGDGYSEPQTYGESSADYFFRLATEVGADGS